MTEKFTLKQMRNVKGITQKQLAAQVGVTERTIISYENNVQDLQKADFIVIHRIAQALNVKVSDIFLGTDSEIPKQNV
uniref:helix-turn-helix transcriptional regulator n=1 Tax=Jeotgalibaca porci TaxID=1868793 RepID=UPI0035A130D5